MPASDTNLVTDNEVIDVCSEAIDNEFIEVISNQSTDQSTTNPPLLHNEVIDDEVISTDDHSTNQSSTSDTYPIGQREQHSLSVPFMLRFNGEPYYERTPRICSFIDEQLQRTDAPQGNVETRVASRWTFLRRHETNVSTLWLRGT